MTCLCCKEYKTAMKRELLEYKMGRPIEELHFEEYVHWSTEDVEPLLDLAIARDYNTIKTLRIERARLPDSVGVKVAALVAKSESLETCLVAKNVFSHTTILSIAKHMRPALTRLSVHGNHCDALNGDIFAALRSFAQRYPSPARRWSLSRDFSDHHFFTLAVRKIKQ